MVPYPEPTIDEVCALTRAIEAAASTDPDAWASMTAILRHEELHGWKVVRVSKVLLAMHAAGLVEVRQPPHAADIRLRGMLAGC